jgi:uncharacterized protein YciI
MQFVIHCLDKPNAKELRLATRPAHLAFIEASPIRIVIAGPLLSADGADMLGSMFIVEANDIDEVRRFSEADPYRKAGLFARVELHPFRRVFPK